MVELVSHDSNLATGSVAESSRPRRQYKEDARRDRKLCGRKREHDQQSAKYTNWFSPFIWRQIELAARHAGRPWSPRAIVREAKKIDRDVFARLTEQVVGRWIDRDAKAQGVSKWKNTVLAQITKGNAPRGENTRVGILVCLSY